MNDQLWVRYGLGGPTFPNNIAALIFADLTGHLYAAKPGPSLVDLEAGASIATSAQLLTIAASSSLSVERIFTLTAPLVGTDSGAGLAYTVAIAPVGQTNGDILIRAAGAWTRLGIGFEGQRLTVHDAAPAYGWAALGSPRRMYDAFSDYNAATFSLLGPAPTYAGTSQPLSSTDGEFCGRRTVGGVGSTAGWYWTAGYGRFDCTYRFRIRIRMDADLTGESFWCGVYNIAGARPTEAAAYTDQHVMFRFIHGTDTKVQLSTADAGGTQTVSDIGVTPVASTAFFAELDFRTAGSVTARIYDSTGATLVGSVTKSTNLPTAATIMSRCMLVVSQGAGTHDIYSSKIHLECY